MNGPSSAVIEAKSEAVAGSVRRRNRLIVWISTLVFVTLGLTFGLLSNGVHHDDDLTHFMFARWAWTFPGYLVNVWGRPGFTVPVSLVAGLGDRETAWHLARGLSTVVTMAGALLAAGMARRLGIRTWAWVVGLCYLQPLNTVLSYTTLTENFTALYLIASLCLLHRRRFVWASVVFSLVLVSRLETVILLPVWWWYVWRRARSASTSPLIVFASVFATLWAPAVQNVVHFIIFGTWPASVFFRPSGSTEYLATGPLAFLPPLLLATSPFVLLLAMIGARRLVRRGAGDVVALAGVYLATHWLIKWFGVFASGGFARFVVAVSPLLAVAAAAGLDVVAEATRRRGRRMMWIGLSAFALLAVGYVAARIEAQAGRLAFDLHDFGLGKPRYFMGGLIVVLASAALVRRRRFGQAVWRVGLLFVLVVSSVEWAVVVRPLVLKPEQSVARDVSRFVGRRAGDPPVFAANPWIAWWRGYIEDPRAHKGPRLLSSMPVGTVFVWDSIYSPSDFHRLHLDRYRDDPAYRLLQTFGGTPEAPTFVVFQKVARTPLEAGGHPYPMPLTLGRGERLERYYVRE